MTSRCLGLEEPLTLSLWLKTAEAYLIPTDLLTHLCVGKERGSFGPSVQQEFGGRGLLGWKWVHTCPNTHTCDAFLCTHILLQVLSVSSSAQFIPSPGWSKCREPITRHFGELVQQGEGKKKFSRAVELWFGSPA